MLKKIITAVSVILTAVFLLLCGASADPAVTTHNTYVEAPAENEESSADTTFAETTDPAVETTLPETEDITETATEEITETEPITESETATEPAPDTESTDDSEEITDSADTISPETEETVTADPVPEETVTEESLTFVPPVKDLPPLTSSSDIDPTKPMIALTFDDGPSVHTDRLLDAFKTHGGKGTFFLVGGNIDYRPDTVKRITAEGHEIGGHSIDHKELTRLSSDEIARQLSWTRDKMYEVTGVDSYIVRPPYGSHNDEVKRIAAGLGIVFINWSVDTLDWKVRNADTVHNKIMNSVFDGAIILCHDIHKTTVDAMETVIPALIKEGYQLVSVSELLAAKHDKLIPGTVYNRK